MSMMRSDNRLSYSELVKIEKFEDRYRYLMKMGRVGEDTFHGRRLANQMLYHSPEWKSVRRAAIIRDDGCDLAMPDRPIGGRVYVHHINPISLEDIVERRKCVFDLENLITVSKRTHDAIHYGTEESLDMEPVVRKLNDTCLWR